MREYSGISAQTGKRICHIHKCNKQTLKKFGLQKGTLFFAVMPQKSQTRFHKEPSWEDIVLNKIALFQFKEPFVQWTDSIIAKGSSWNINSNKEPLFIYYVMERFFGY